MIDYIKLSITSLPFARSLTTNIHLAKHRTVIRNSSSTDVDEYKFRGLTFAVYKSGRVVINGSLHKYFNGGRHNYNDFSFEYLKRAILELCELFGDEILNFQINNLEYGFNISPSFPVLDYTNSLIVYRSKGIFRPAPITRKDRRGFEKGTRFSLTQYEVKIYHKTQHYKGAPLNILRIEFKTLKMECIKELQIGRLEDLLNKEKLSNLHKKFFKLFLNCISCEDIEMRKLSNEEKFQLLEAKNALYWVELDSANQNYKIRTRLAKFQKLQDNYGTSNRKQEIEGLLNEKFRQLI